MPTKNDVFFSAGKKKTSFLVGKNLKQILSLFISLVAEKYPRIPTPQIREVKCFVSRTVIGWMYVNPEKLWFNVFYNSDVLRSLRLYVGDTEERV